jgi:hypothetical protein
MKKFYFSVLATIGFLCTALSSAAQLTQYRTVPSGTFPADIVLYDLANPKYWLLLLPIMDALRMELITGLKSL